MANTPTIKATVEQIRDGFVTSHDWVQNSLSQIHARPEVAAWSYVDGERALARADRMDQMRKQGRAFGRLHGCPIGLKDIIEVAGMPYGCGSSLMGETSASNAALVDALESEGAVILGKTETTEFASMTPSPARNPLNTEYSPGGSSAGSAAAVAAGQVPVAIGSQTNGSVIRPASYCGVYGMKPSAGMISRTGTFEQSPTLDQMGLFATCLDDLALVLDCLSHYDSRDAHSLNEPRPNCSLLVSEPAPIEPNFAVLQLPYADRQSPDCTAGFAELLETLEGRVEILEAPPVMDQVIQAHRIIHLKEMVAAFSALGFLGKSALSPQIQAALTEGDTYSDAQYQDSLGIRTAVMGFFENLFDDFNAILTPSASGEAPRLEEGHTGDPIFCTIWTLAGLPCINLPILQGANGLPIGTQVIGRKDDDGRLFRTANWLIQHLFTEGAA